MTVHCAKEVAYVETRESHIRVSPYFSCMQLAAQWVIDNLPKGDHSSIFVMVEKASNYTECNFYEDGS